MKAEVEIPSSAGDNTSFSAVINDPDFTSRGRAYMFPGFLESPWHAHIDLLAKELNELGLTTIGFVPYGTWKGREKYKEADMTQYTISRMLADIKELYQWSDKQFGIGSKTINVGHSLGAFLALVDGARHPISGICAIMPSQRVAQRLQDRQTQWRENALMFHVDHPTIDGKQEEFSVPVTFYDDGQDPEYNTIEAARKIAAPKLFIAGTFDRMISLGHVRTIYDQAANPKSFVELPIRHKYRTDAEQMKRVNQEVVVFLEQYIL